MLWFYRLLQQTEVKLPKPFSLGFVPTWTSDATQASANCVSIRSSGSWEEPVMFIMSGASPWLINISVN